MFCPKCGVRNLEDVKFCRACGANISLVPQALAGSLTESAAVELQGQDEKVSQREEAPTLEKGFENIFGAVAFFIIVLLGYLYMRGMFWIWVWFIIPALQHLGKGIGQLIRARRDPHMLAPSSPVGALHGADTHALPGAPTSENIPPSVTEETTRSLGAAAPRATRNAH